MKFYTACSLLLASTCTAHAFQPVAFAPTGTRSRSATINTAMNTGTSTSTTALYSTAADEKKKSKKDDRLRMMKSGQFHRQGFKEVRQDVEKTMEDQFKGRIVEDLRSNNFVMERDGVKVHLAKVGLYLSFETEEPYVYRVRLDGLN